MKKPTMEHANINHFSAGYTFRGDGFSNPYEVMVKVHIGLGNMVLAQAVADELGYTYNKLQEGVPGRFSLKGPRTTNGEIELTKGQHWYDMYNLCIRFSREYWARGEEVGFEERILNALVEDVNAYLFGIDKTLRELKPLIKAVELVNKVSAEQAKDTLPF